MKNFSGKIVISFMFTFTMINSSFSYEFDCDGAKTVVSTLKMGPDRVNKKLFSDPERFVKNLVPGWQCSTDPFPPEKNNRAYLEKIECFQSNDKVPVRSNNLAEAGRQYQRNLSQLIQCFPDNINSTPKTYVNTTKGEGLVLAIDEYVTDRKGKNYHILVEYGYFQDGKSPIIWEISATIGSRKVNR
ncbi:MAG TPA: hypothetical protein ENH82_04095 [bacterium]|nr:hypothetical protein [bacterium]